jgi:hypothetical protein
MLNIAYKADKSTHITYYVSKIFNTDIFREIIAAKPYSIPVDDDAINVVFTTNATNINNYMPMTAWIMAHRISHIFLYNHKHDASQNFIKIERLMTDMFYKTINTYYSVPNRTQVDNTKQDIIPSYELDSHRTEVMTALVSNIFTMRSARNNKLRNVLDFSAELFAQYLISGHIKFGTLPDKILSPEGIHNILKISESEKQQLLEEWHALAPKMETLIDELLDSLIGKVLVL